MPILDKVTTDLFLERFNSFYDAVLRRVEISFLRNGERCVSVWIEAADSQSMEGDQWVCVRLTVSGVKDFCLSQTENSSSNVLSDGIHLSWFDGILGLDLGHFSDAPASIEEQRLSKVFIAGAKIDWSVGAYEA